MTLVAILGMHRSGTSCLAHALHEAGLHLGADLMNAAARDNLEGHWEHLEAVRINDRILQLSGGAWDTVPSALTSDAEVEADIDRFLGKLRIRPLVGWKDPRTTITFPVWKPRLTDYRIVAALRHPMSVARSLETRNSLPLERGLRLWTEYNRRLLEHVRQEDRVLWYDFDAPAEQVAGNILGICRELGLRCDQAVADVFNPYLRHHRDPEPIADPEIGDLYQTLRDLAAVQVDRPPPRPRAAVPADEGRTEPAAEGQAVKPVPRYADPLPERRARNPPVDETAVALRRQLAQLDRVQVLHNGTQQQALQQIEAVQVSLHAVHTHLGSLITGQQQLHAADEASSAALEALRVQLAGLQSHLADRGREIEDLLQARIASLAADLATERMQERERFEQQRLASHQEFQRVQQHIVEYEQRLGEQTERLDRESELRWNWESEQRFLQERHEQMIEEIQRRTAGLEASHHTLLQYVARIQSTLLYRLARRVYRALRWCAAPVCAVVRCRHSAPPPAGAPVPEQDSARKAA